MRKSGTQMAALCGKILILACLVATWGLTLPASAQPDRGADVPADDSEDAFDTVNRPAAAPAAGKAGTQRKRRGIPTRLSELFIAGGPMMWPLAGCSVVVLSFAIERMAVLRRRRVIPRDFVTRFLDHLEKGQLDRAAALELCEQNGSPIAEVFAQGVRKWGKSSVEVEQAIIDGGERQVGRLRRHLRVLNTVATISPLMGLLGTVWGMILCFNEIATRPAAMGGKTDDLAAGIGMALVATAGGLCVAIPALILYMYLAGRVDSLVIEMDYVSQKLVNLISAEALQSGDLPRIAPRPKTLGTAALKNS